MLDWQFGRGHNFWFDHWISIKLLQQFLEDIFLGFDLELLLGEAMVWSCQPRVTVRKCHNFWYNRWIAIKILQEFLEALFYEVDVESILYKEEVWSRQPSVMF
jgi:hypothetical protein